MYEGRSLDEIRIAKEADEENAAATP